MPINGFLYPGAKFTPAYEVDNSLRFNSGDSAYLSRSASGSTTSNTKFTISFWTKRANLGAKQVIFMHENASSHNHKFEINFRTDNKITIETFKDSYEYNVISDAVFRDVSAWYHFVVRVDTTQSTESDRYRIYANGVQLTLTEAGNGYPTQNFEFNLGTKILAVGRYQGSSPDHYLNGYLTEVLYCDGQSLDPTSFGEFDSDSPTIWKPKDVSGLTFGNNGFHLDFEDSSNLGNDVSSNASDFTANNLAATDQSTDTCTNNFCTLNPLDRSTLSSDGTTFTEGNLKTTDGSSNYLVATGTMAVTQGKWYFEVKIDATASHTASGVKIVDLDGWDRTDGSANGSYGWLYAANGDKRNGGSSSSYGDAFSANDIIGVAIDMDNKAVYFSRNGTFQASGNPASGASKTNAAFTNLTGTITAQVYDGSSGQAHEFSMNFGSPPYSISSGNSDANGYGNFEYSVPSGYYALNTKNLAEFG